jgi:hypothetical protein
MDISDIDRVSRWRTLFRWAARPARPGQEPWRRLALRLQYETPNRDDSRSALLVTAGAGDHGARCGLELAMGMADESGKPVLLVDAAPRERTLSALLKCDGRRGLTDLLFEPEPPLQGIVLGTTHPSVFFVPAGIIAEPAGHVAAERAGRLLEALQADHAMVLFCGGDIPANGFALALASVVGRVAVLAIENETTSEELEAAQESLRLRNARDIGLVLATRARVPA